MQITQVMLTIFVFFIRYSYCVRFSPQKVMDTLVTNKQAVLDTGSLINGAVSDTMALSAEAWKVKYGKVNDKSWTAYQQAMTTLMVADYGGGALAPIIEGLIDDYLDHRDLFEDCTKFLTDYNNAMVDDLGKANQMELLKNRKIKFIEKFQDVIENGGTKIKGMKEKLHVIGKFMRLKGGLKVGLAVLGKAIGPIFDVLGIAIDVWKLVDCYRTQTCETRAIVSSALGIVSGVIGFTTAVLVAVGKATLLASVGGPAAMAVVGVVIGITATLVGSPYFNDEGEAEVNVDDVLKAQDQYSEKALKKIVESLNTTIKGNFFSVKGGKFFNEKKPIKLSASDSTWGTVAEGDDNKENNGKNNVFLLNYDYLIKSKIDEEKRNILRRYKSVGLEFEGKDNDIVIIGDMPWLRENQQIKIKFGKGNGSLIIDGFLGYLGKENTVGKHTVEKLNADLNAYGVNVLSLLGLDMQENMQGNKYSAWGIRFGLRGRFEVYVYDMLHSSNQGKKFQKDRSYPDHYGSVENVDILIGSTGVDEITLSSQKNTYEYLEKFYKSINLYGQVYNWKYDHFSNNGFDFTVYKFLGSAIYTVDINHEIEHLLERKKVSDGFRHHIVPSKYKINDNTRGKHFNFKVLANNTPIAKTEKDNESSDNNKICESTNTFSPPILFITNLPDDALPNDILYKDRRYIEIYGKIETPRNSAKKVRDVAAECPNVDESVNSNAKGGEGGKELLATVFIHTHCPFMLYAMTVSNKCISVRKEDEIDVVRRNGQFTFTLGTQAGRVTNELVILKCPNEAVETSEKMTFRWSGGYLMIRRDDLLEPCGFDEKSSNEKYIKVIRERTSVSIMIKGNDTHEFQLSVPARTLIINEFGTTIWEDGDGDRDLLTMFYEKTLRNSATDIIRQEAFDEMEACIKKNETVLASVGVNKIDCVDVDDVA